VQMQMIVIVSRNVLSAERKEEKDAMPMLHSTFVLFQNLVHVHVTPFSVCIYKRSQEGLPIGINISTHHLQYSYKFIPGLLRRYVDNMEIPVFRKEEIPKMCRLECNFPKICRKPAHPRIKTYLT